MLRFDIKPVCANAYRFQAAMSFLIAALYIYTDLKWASIFLLAGGF